MKYKPRTVAHSFTTKSSGLSNMLVLEIGISQVNQPVNIYKTFGIWDTGATSTVITKEVADYLQLKQSGVISVSTATISNVLQPTYFVDVFLKKDLRVQAVQVTVGNIAAESGLHCLIGMDIITLGDFSITNFEGNTCLSFRVPSLHEVDFVKKTESYNRIVDLHLGSRRLGMNNPCSCGSGRKFKNCHGKDLIEDK